MNVLLVRRGSITIVDGISTYILELASALNELGHKVYILCGQCSNTNDMEYYLKEHFFGENVPNIKIINWGKVTYIPNIKKQIMLKRISEELNIDVVHFNGFVPYFIDLRRATVMTHHGFPLFVGYNIRMPLHLIGYRILQYVSRYDWVIALSRKHLRELKELAPKLAEDSVVIPPGIDIQRIRRIVGRIDVKRKNTVLHIGTRHQKNPEISVLAFAIAYKRYGVKEANLTIVGNPTKNLLHVLQELPSDIRSRVTFVRTLPKTQLLKLIAEARILLAPSIYEAFPILSLEAIALGTPIIVSSAIPEEVVANGVTGFRVNDPLNYKAFGKLLARVLKDESLWSELHKKCLKRAEMFDSRRIAKILIKTYKEL